MGVQRDLVEKAQKDPAFASLVCGFAVQGLANPEVRVTEITYGGNPSRARVVIRGIPSGAAIPNPPLCEAVLSMDWEMARRSSPGGNSGSVGLYKNIRRED